MSDKSESPITTRPLQVLHLEDSSQDAELVRDRLDGAGVAYNILVVDGRASFEAALAEQSFDLILSDYSMVGYDGVTALKHAQATQPDVPVILISGTVIDEDAVKCLHLGATDYLLKGRLERLVPAVHRAIQEAETRRQRRQAEAAVRRERDRAQQYLDTADVILLALDLDARVTLINRKGCDVVGWTERELLGRDWIETCLPARIRHAIQEKRHNVINGDFSIVENPILMKTGEERLIEWHNAVLRDDDGHVIGTFSSGTDVSEQRRTEAELQRLNKEIEVQRLRVFKATMRTVQDIVNNLLNALQLVHLEVECLPAAEIQPLVGQAIREAAVKLETLGNLETIIEKEMIVGPGIDYPGSGF